MKLAGFVIPDNEVEFVPIRASGPGGQHVNKVSTAIHLRFDIRASSLPQRYKEMLLQVQDQRVTSDGIVVIKARQFRSQEKNKMSALQRLDSFIVESTRQHKPRKTTTPTRASKVKRITDKKARGKIKNLRGSGNIPED